MSKFKKVTYKTSNLFSFKKYKSSNLNSISYEYPTIYGIKCAILGSIITIEGINKAKELFNKLKNMKIYVQFPNNYSMGGQYIKRYSNSYYKEYNKNNTTMGYREYAKIDEIVFYIDNSLDNVELYLKNIDWLGTAESMVYLHGIENTNTLENVLVEWNKIDKVKIYEQSDYVKNTSFDTVYMYSDKRKHNHRTYMCMIDSITLTEGIEVF